MNDTKTMEWKRLAGAYLRAVEALLQHIDIDAVGRVAHRLHAARTARATVYVAGNGGSAATASHFVNDLCKATRRPELPPMRVLGLSDNTPWFTALANDEGYERVFAGQLENLGQPGDVLIVISASGNSPNLVRAVESARVLGIISIGFLGFDGGMLKDMVDECVWVPTPKGWYGPVEDAHSALCHLLSVCMAGGPVYGE
jgi:D-sedoheptulose 7-phosphate isomerase